MRTIARCAAIILLPLLFGCSSISTVRRPSSYYDRASLSEGDETLFSSDNAILTDDEINRILAYHYSPQPQNRIAIIAFGQSYWFGWSDELARSGVEVQSKLVSKLRSSPLVYDASYLPSLLIPKKKTVPQFREAGARYQADLLLIYNASCRTYEKSRLFGPDKSKSYCNVEAILLDTRTGIVPFTVTASRDFFAEKSDQDLNLDETMRRTELNALADALGEVGDAVVRFLGSAGK